MCGALVAEETKKTLSLAHAKGVDFEEGVASAH
jgi:hypothetical protein